MPNDDKKGRIRWGVHIDILDGFVITSPEDLGDKRGRNGWGVYIDILDDSVPPLSTSEVAFAPSSLP